MVCQDSVVGRGVRTGWLAIFAVAAIVAASPAAAAGAGERGRRAERLIDCRHAAERVTVTVSSRLDGGCTYTGGFDITASNVTLDCRGALVLGSPADSGSGVAVSVAATADLEDVTIRNCRIQGFEHGIDLARNTPSQLAPGHEYDHHLRHVVIEHDHISGARGVGVYVHPYVTETTIRHDVVTGSGSTAVYLDEGSRGAHIEGDVIAGNGSIENGPGGANTDFGGVTIRYWGPGREGIALDGSRGNVIRGNWIVGNSAGGVFLYTNCGENVHNDPVDWLDHRFDARDNVVSDNVISGSGTGVWVGSRMGENVYPMDCSDVPYVSGPLRSITLDRAPHNTVQGNVIVGADFGVRVEDDHTTVTGNRFVAPSAADYGVVVGTPYRTNVLHEPVSDTVVARNVSSIAGNPSPYRWVDGVAGLRDDRNLASGHLSPFCRAPDVPRGPFVMVYAFALQDPSQPPVPAPAYKVPSLGVLPACGSREVDSSPATGRPRTCTSSPMCTAPTTRVAS